MLIKKVNLLPNKKISFPVQNHLGGRGVGTLGEWGWDSDFATAL